MKKSSVLSAVVLSVALLSSNAHASGGGFADFWQKIVSYFQTTIEKKEIYQGEEHQYTHSWEGYSHHNGSGHKNVPEMDAAGAGLTLGLLASLIAIRRDRKKRSAPQSLTERLSEIRHTLVE